MQQSPDRLDLPNLQQSSRRQVLRRFVTGASILGGVVLLAACGGGAAIGAGTAAVGSSSAATATTSAASSTGQPATAASTTVGAASVTTSTSEAASASPANPGKLQGSVRVVWQDPTTFPGYKEIWEKTFTLFQQEHPDAKVDPIWITGDRDTAILTRVASGDPGEVFWTNNAAAMHEFSARKISRPLDDLVASSKYDLSQHYAQVIAMNRYQGKLYGMPQDSHPGIAGIFYNADLFQKSGVAVPPASWQYADLVSTAQKLSTPNAANPQFGFVGMQDSGRYYTPMYSWGAGLLNQDGTASTATDPKTVAVMQWLDDLFHKDNVYPDSATVSKLKGTIGMFQSGNAAMVPAGYWQIAGLVKANKSLNWKTLPVPVGPAGRVSGYAANDNLSLFTAGKNLEAAWNYSLIWMRDEIMLQVVQIGLNPASKPAVNKNPELQKLSYADALKVYVDQLESNSYDSVPTPANQLQGMVLTATDKAISTLWQGKTGVDQVIQTLDQALKATLAKPLPTG
jgi:ABC-type glycerol-3-phosphate transport system substrate-binding protein